MSLSNALNIALSGLRFTQANLEVISQNVVRANDPGYSRKTLQTVEQFSSSVGGIRIGDITREVDLFIQQQFRTELSLGVGAEISSDFQSRLDQMFGEPGQANALDVVFNEFGLSLQALVTSPDQFGARQSVLDQAQTMVGQLNRLSGDIQDLRREAEANLSILAEEANLAINQIARLNVEIQAAFDTGGTVSNLQDQRDIFIDKLSQLMDIRTNESDRGVVRVFTTGGNLLADLLPTKLSFDEHANLDASALYSTNDNERGVGTLTLTTANGGTVDLFKQDIVRAGSIATYRELRDTVLVDAQAQIDQLAHGLALALSSVEVPGTAVSAGPNDGFDLDISGLQSGNPIEVTFRETPPGIDRTVTFIRVDDPSALPLENNVTANPNDSVIGIDFSGGVAAAVAAMDAALGGNVTVSSPVAGTLRILDDGAGGVSDIISVSATVTTMVASDNGLAVPLFVDLEGVHVPYTNSQDGGGQITGFAARISINPDILNDPSLLVLFSTNPPTGSGDPARPLDLFARFNDQAMTFEPVAGIGSESQPYTGTIKEFVQRIINFNGQRASALKATSDAQTIVVGALQQRLESDTKVNVDQEMADLLVLQNAFAANARVMSVIQEMMQILINI